MAGNIKSVLMAIAVMAFGIVAGRLAAQAMAPKGEHVPVRVEHAHTQECWDY